MTGNNPNQDLVNINAYTKFGKILSICSQDIERNRKSDINLLQRGSYMVWEINMGVCPCLEFDNIMLFNCRGNDFYIYGAFEFFMQFNC